MPAPPASTSSNPRFPEKRTAIFHSAVGEKILLDRAFARHKVPTFANPERALLGFVRATERQH
jgi:hypothetical protein